MMSEDTPQPPVIDSAKPPAAESTKPSKPKGSKKNKKASLKSKSSASKDSALEPPKDVTDDKKPQRRDVHFILDHSACTLGLGNIERWFNKDFAQSQTPHPEHIHLHLYVPQYTLRELDFQRRGPMVGISLAQEAIKLIDSLFEAEASVGGSGNEDVLGDELELVDAPQNTEFDLANCPIQFNIHIEEISQLYPSWENCLRYRMWHPKQGDLPHIHIANEEEQMERQAEISLRLKNLIRSCIYMTKMKHKDQPAPSGDHWRLVTEDQATKVWATSFGVDCLNVNEAELLLFHANDVTRFELVNPGAEFFSEQDVFDRQAPAVGLHKKVDTTEYRYESIEKKNDEKGKKKGKKSSAKKKDAKDGAENVKPAFVKVNGVSYEDFDQINYAPRTATVPLVESQFLESNDRPIETE
ncbi:hypothetical protein PUMCH_004363 [Australozyma saopauloensis]|uniref:Nonsense-mediated decay protein 4 n=1 Tax=Australozyma saopauloensis TaxID=291208 RepID=A0AAX4HFJ7_9ASCO|nr:hypothetical protein PUMCH_004363 [[Candida] saopauloensis]